ncbi:MAG TPA: glycosyltransferase family 2 protein, partial [Gammaproteobacteria bacterium]|nr:glycosyltransferase family 2 protein [Gammaproteobacteria bacterium]
MDNDLQPPLLSLIMPCYNEEDVIGYTIPRLVQAFERNGYPLELVACNNGSSDRTGELIDDFIAEGYPIVLKHIEINEGYGNGVLQSIPLCTGTLIGIIPADGQVDAEDVVRVYESVARSNGLVMGKVFRRFRLDGPWRSVVTMFYNLFMLSLWPNIGSYDVNGSPKIMHRKIVEAMQLESRDWLLDPEIMIKASYM